MAIEKEIKELLQHSRFEERGLKHNPFNIEHKDIKKRRVNRNEEILQAIEHSREFSLGNIHNVAILGTHGIGKSFFMRLLKEMLSKYMLELQFNTIYYIENLLRFKELFNEELVSEKGTIRFVETAFYREIKEHKNNNYCILIDDLDIIFEQYSRQVIELMQLENVIIFGAWNVSAWKRAKKMIHVKIPETEIIYLKTLSKEQCIDIIKKRLISTSIKKNSGLNLFSEKVIEYIAYLSNGRPYQVIRNSKRLLTFMLENNLKTIDLGENFEEFKSEIKPITSEELLKKMKNLNKTQRRIIDLLREKVELTSSEVGKRLKLSRTGALKQLQNLEKEELIESRMKNNKREYYLKEEIEYSID